MAFKQKGFPMHSTKSAFKSHPSPELERLKKDVETFQKQHDEDDTEYSQKDLNWAKQALEEYMSGADGGDHSPNKPQSPVKLWPWSKKARKKRRENRAYKKFNKATEVVDGKTYIKEGYEIVDGKLIKIKK